MGLLLQILSKLSQKISLTGLSSSGHTICSLSPALLIFPLQCIKLQARPVISNSAEKLASYSRKDERGGGSQYSQWRMEICSV